MKIVFVNPPYAFAPEDGAPAAPLSPDTVATSTFPIGLAILAAISREMGHDVSAVEMPFLTECEVERRIIQHAPDVVACSCWTGNQRVLARLSSRLRSSLPRACIVWGGHHATLLGTQVIENYDVDVVVQGEGEVPFRQLLVELDGGPTASAPGILRRNKLGKTEATGERVRLNDLDTFPMPAYDLFVLARNDGREVRYGAKPFSGASRRTTVLAARGCPYKCTFCVDGKLFSKAVSRDVQRVVDELEYLSNVHDVHLFEFNDMTFTLSQKRTASLCHEILRRGLDISWQAMSRVNVVSDELLALMRAAGCYSISFGVESGSPILLRRIQKEISPGEIVRAFRVAAGVGLSTTMLLMVGNPGETEDTISETIDLIYQARPTQIDPSIYQVYPGSKTYSELRISGYISDDYWLYNDAAPYYTGEHPFEKLKYWQNKISFHHSQWPRDRSIWGFFGRLKKDGIVRRRA